MYEIDNESIALNFIPAPCQRETVEYRANIASPVLIRCAKQKAGLL